MSYEKITNDEMNFLLGNFPGSRSNSVRHVGYDACDVMLSKHKKNSKKIEIV